MSLSHTPQKDVGTNEGLLKIDNLAAAQYRNGNIKGSVELLRKALFIREQSSIDKNGVEILNNMNNLASALGRLKLYGEAEENFRAVLLAREMKLGKDHMDTLVTVNYLGVIIKQQKKLIEAEQFLLRALTGFKLLEDAGCPLSPIFAETNYNYAILCVQLGKRRKAGRHFGIALEGLTRELGSDDPHTLDALDWEIRCMSDSTFTNTLEQSDAKGAGSSTVEEHSDKEDQKDEEEDNEINDVAGTLDSDIDNLETTVTDIPISKLIYVDEEEIYTSRSDWMKGKQCGLCNQTFKVIPLIKFFMSYILLDIFFSL